MSLHFGGGGAAAPRLGLASSATTTTTTTAMDSSDWEVSSRGSSQQQQQQQQQQRRLSLSKLEGDDCQDDPEELIRDDARTVNCIRWVLIVVMVLATLLTAVANYTLLVRLQMRAFSKDFEALSTKLIQSFLEDLQLKMWQAHVISLTMTGANLLNSSMPFFDQLYQASQATSQTSLMVFSPLLYDETARSTWETYAREQIARRKAESSMISVLEDGELVGRSSNIIPTDDVCHMNVGDSLVTDTQHSSGPCDDGNGKAPRETTSFQKSRETDTFLALHNVSQIFNFNETIPMVAKDERPYSPAWQVSSTDASFANFYNQMSDPHRRVAIEAVVRAKYPVLTRLKSSSSSSCSDGELEHLFSRIDEMPTFSLFYPIFSDLGGERVTGTISFDFSWKRILRKILPVGSDGIDLVLENTCGQMLTFAVDSNMILAYVGEGDRHDKIFESMKLSSDYDDFHRVQHHSGIERQPQQQNVGNNLDCKYRLHVYPSVDFPERYKTSTPGIVTSVMIVTFLVMSIVFFAYDRVVSRLQRKVMSSARRYNSFLSTLFPSIVRSRLFNSPHKTHSSEADDAMEASTSNTNRLPRIISFLPSVMVTPKLQLKNYLENGTNRKDSYENLNDEPIADLFPNTTVFFADIAGFTAWSSEREPLNVFKLLETLYSAFDRIAARLGVFKVETVGDCYVAVTGLPEPQEDHAIIMSIFASECLSTMRELTKSLECTLGPSTASLALRVGMHSGPVIAGVLRGEKSRFQLFGDTMNTASRMETNGVVNRIHVSLATADLLKAAGKSDWISSREDQVFAKGKGTMQTYWVCPKGTPRQRVPLPHELVDHVAPVQRDLRGTWEGVEMDISNCSLVQWNVDLLQKHLQKIIAHRLAATPWVWRHRKKKRSEKVPIMYFECSHPRDEVVEALPMPEFSAAVGTNAVDPANIRLPEPVLLQLRSFVARVAAMYHKNNAFHNFEHASHVAMSSSKLLNRVLAPDGVDYNKRAVRSKSKYILAMAQEFHETTFGITSDPLLQFAAVFSALVHDLDHDGVPNHVLAMERSPIALKYNNKTVAEQHSIDTAWRLLMEDQYQDLRACIYQTESEMLRFRQLVVNAVIATDIADESLQVWREARWTRAFHSSHVDTETPHRKASIFFAYILQASDVAHTMQHWHTYRKWNERLFAERYTAYQNGRSVEDPSFTWYEDEICFFDSYIIPLAQKLEDCGVFGVTSHEYFMYAVENRGEWVSKGKDIVQELAAKYALQQSSTEA